MWPRLPRLPAVESGGAEVGFLLVQRRSPPPWLIFSHGARCLFRSWSRPLDSLWLVGALTTSKWQGCVSWTTSVCYHPPTCALVIDAGEANRATPRLHFRLLFARKKSVLSFLLQRAQVCRSDVLLHVIELSIRTLSMTGDALLLGAASVSFDNYCVPIDGGCRAADEPREPNSAQRWLPVPTLDPWSIVHRPSSTIHRRPPDPLRWVHCG